MTEIIVMVAIASAMVIAPVVLDAVLMRPVREELKRSRDDLAQSQEELIRAVLDAYEAGMPRKTIERLAAKGRARADQRYAN